MGVLAPGSAHARPSARLPIDTSGNFPAHMSAESPSNISPNPFKKPKNNPQGGSPNFVWVNISFFCENFKSCPRVPKLRIWLLRGWGRCLKVTLQTQAPENFRSRRWGPSGGSCVRRPGSEDPIGVSGIDSSLCSSQSCTLIWLHSAALGSSLSDHQFFWGGPETENCLQAGIDYGHQIYLMQHGLWNCMMTILG